MPLGSRCYNSHLPTNPQHFASVNTIGGRDDSDLIARIQRRDPRAMGTLYDLYGKVCYAVILRLVPERFVAEDLLAETFVKAWNQIGRWKDLRGDDLGVWLLVLARNHALEHLRAINLPRPAALPKLIAFEQPTTLQDTTRGRGTDYWGKLRKKLEALSPEERRIMEYFCFEGFSASAIAIKAGKTLESVKTSVAAALEKLNPRSAKL